MVQVIGKMGDGDGDNSNKEWDEFNSYTFFLSFSSFSPFLRTSSPSSLHSSLPLALLLFFPRVEFPIAKGRKEPQGPDQQLKVN